MPTDFWPLLLAQLPIVGAVLVALYKGWIVMGPSHKAEIDAKDEQLQEKNKDIEFREKLRQDALADIAILRERDQERTEVSRELTEVVKQTLALNDRLLNENLGIRWDGISDRRRNSPRAK